MLALSRHGLGKLPWQHLQKVQLLQESHLVACYSTRLTDSEILHHSVLPTDHFQRSLPHLPIPELSKTCDRYLQSQRPILNAEDFSRTEKITKEFQNGVGKVLHDELVAKDKANRHTSYISAPWSDMYLKDRRPVSLNHNPFMSFKDDPNPAYNDQLIRASNFCVSSMRFLKTLRAKFLEPEVFHLNPKKSDTKMFRNIVKWMPNSIAAYGAIAMKAFPLDMSQFSSLFNTNRIPRPNKDELYQDTTVKHVLVLRRGHLYTVDLLDRDGNVVPGQEIMSHLKYIIEDPRPPAESPLGIMTTEDRDTWTGVRASLEASGNMDQLRAIDGALFALVLDDHKPADPAELSRQFLHSDGTNRWFDKCFSLMFTGNGEACVNFEHSWGDGVAVLRYFNECFTDTTTNPSVHPDTKPSNVDSSAAVRKLEFNYTPEVKQAIQTAKSKFAAATASLDLNFIQFTHFGKNFIKQQKLSPDSFMQLAIQLAFYRQYGKVVPTYESCSTSAFKHGRTETIRPATMATKAMCEMFESGNHGPEELRKGFDECSKVHGQLTKEAAMGQGFDRHLFAMKYYAAMHGDVPEFYKDPSYAYINHIVLSTSTLSSPALGIGGFGAVTQDGYGIGYGIEDNQLGFIITGYPPHRDIYGYLDCMQETLDDMRRVLEGGAISH